MESLPNLFLLIAMFLIRLGAPLLLTVAIGYGLKRLDAKWQAEAEAPEIRKAPTADSVAAPLAAKQVR